VYCLIALIGQFAHLLWPQVEQASSYITMHGPNAHSHFLILDPKGHQRGPKDLHSTKQSLPAAYPEQSRYYNLYNWRISNVSSLRKWRQCFRWSVCSLRYTIESEQLSTNLRGCWILDLHMSTCYRRIRFESQYCVKIAGLEALNQPCLQLSS